MRLGRGLAVATALAVAMTAAPAAQAGTATGTVVRVVDGDTVKLRVGKRTRTYHLKGIDAPERRGSAERRCYGRQAHARLKRLLRRGARVRVRTRGRSRQAEIRRGRRDVNRDMVRRGYARAKSGNGSYGRRLRRDERVARARNRGLWKACAAPDVPGAGEPGSPTAPGGAPQQGDLTGQAAIDHMSGVLSDAAFRTFKTEGNTSDEGQLHLCGDRRVRAYLRTSFADPGFSHVTITEWFGNPWRVVDALVKADGSYMGARVQARFDSKRTRSGGGESTEPTSEELDVLLEHTGGRWLWTGRPAEHHPGQASCDPAA